MLGLLNRLFGANELVSSQLFNEKTFYGQFQRDLERANQEIVIESPFMTSRRVTSLLPGIRRAVQRKVKVVVNTRVPEEHDEYLRGEAQLMIAELEAIGVDVLITGGHHRKLAVIDRKLLWEGSHNILSQNESCEIMRRIESETLAQQTIRFIGLNRFL